MCRCRRCRRHRHRRRRRCCCCRRRRHHRHYHHHCCCSCAMRCGPERPRLVELDGGRVPLIIRRLIRACGILCANLTFCDTPMIHKQELPWEFIADLDISILIKWPNTQGKQTFPAQWRLYYPVSSYIVPHQLFVGIGGAYLDETSRTRVWDFLC